MMKFADENEARQALPAGSKWSSSFGYPGEGGYSEYHRAPDGSRWVIENGPWCGPEEWSLKKLEQ